MAGRQKKVIKRTGALKKPLRPRPKNKTPSAQSTLNASKIRDKKHLTYIVGIGASAGGLEAFQEFFTHMPSDSGMAFVLVPHLDPTHKSIIGEILKKYTAMDIVQAEDGLKVLPNRVYLIQPDKNIAILHGRLQLIEPAERRGLRHPIDFFFRTLAEDQGEKAIAVILSGTGTEGTLGLKAVKGEGGLVIVQDPKTAKYDGMPRSAITTDLVDYVLPVHKIPEVLLKFIHHPHSAIMRKTEHPLEKHPDALQKVYILIRNQTGHDFSQYKTNTIIRRIEKRMTFHQIDNIMNYVTYLRDNPSEINTLFKDILIRVTGFFRDPESFEQLKKAVFPDLFKRAGEADLLRVWVPGCSSGEEAYSMAIVLSEYSSEQNLPCKIQVFATDLDSDAIETARSGIYPNSISSDISQKRLKQYFVKEDDSYRISSKIRELVVFAVQNVTKDPPFSRVDMISCRNLLIYLGPELQKKIIPLFHYALKPEGILFLGTSETVGAFSDLFTPVSNKWKIFKPKKFGLVSSVSPDYYAAQPKTATLQTRHVDKERMSEISLGDMIGKLLVDLYTPPCVIIDENGSILYFHGHTGKYLEPAPGKARFNIFEMAREGLRLELKAQIRNAITRKKNVLIKDLKVRSNGDIYSIDVTIKHINKPAPLKGLLMVIFEEAMPSRPPKVYRKLLLRKRDGSRRATVLEFELKTMREQLQNTIEELEASNEELQSTNEELQSANEELQSSNEELETSREELQSVNEELMTVNAESQNKIDELMQVTNDMNNLLAATKMPTIFLDSNLNIKRFTPTISTVIKLIQTDIGRPVRDFASSLKYDDMIHDAGEVLRTLIPKEVEVSDINNVWYLMRIIPYRTIDNVIDGVVITFAEITGQKRAQQELRDALIYTERIIDSIREPMIVLDTGMKVVSANRTFYETFKVRKEDTEGKIIYDLGNHQWDIPKLRHLLENILREHTDFHDYAVEHDFPSIGYRKMLLNARKIIQTSKEAEMILLVIEDVTGIKS